MNSPNPPPFILEIFKPNISVNKVVKVHPGDDVIVALTDLEKGEEVVLDGETYTLTENIPVKHKFAARTFAPGDEVHMYGCLLYTSRCV